VDKNEAVGLAVRLFAIFVTFFTLSYVPTILYLLDITKEKVWFLLSLGFSAFMLLLAFVMWRFSLAIAGKLLPPFSPSETTSRFSVADLESVALVILGLYVLAGAVPAVFHWATLAYQSTKMTPWMYDPSPLSITSMVSTAVKLIIGLWLLFGGKGLRGLIRKARVAGTNR